MNTIPVQKYIRIALPALLLFGTSYYIRSMEASPRMYTETSLNLFAGIRVETLEDLLGYLPAELLVNHVILATPIHEQVWITAYLLHDIQNKASMHLKSYQSTLKKLNTQARQAVQKKHRFYATYLRSNVLCNRIHYGTYPGRIQEVIFELASARQFEEEPLSTCDKAHLIAGIYFKKLQQKPDPLSRFKHELVDEAVQRGLSKEESKKYIKEYTDFYFNSQDGRDQLLLEVALRTIIAKGNAQALFNKLYSRLLANEWRHPFQLSDAIEQIILSFLP